jgi:hypothetical protein
MLTVNARPRGRLHDRDARHAFQLRVPGDEPFRGGLHSRRREGDRLRRRAVRATLVSVSDPHFAVLITAANRCVANRLGAAVATAGGEAMRPSFGFVIRAVAARRRR